MISLDLDDLQAYLVVAKALSKVDGFLESETKFGLIALHFENAIKKTDQRYASKTVICC